MQTILYFRYNARDDYTFVLDEPLKCYDLFFNNTEEYITKELYIAIDNNDIDYFHYIVKVGYRSYTDSMYYVAKKGVRSFVELCINNGLYYYEYDYDKGLLGATEGGHLDIIKYFISLGAKLYDSLIFHAAKHKHMCIIEFLITETNPDYNIGMAGASLGGHFDIVKYFIGIGANDYNWGAHSAVIGGHIELLDFFIKIGKISILDDLLLEASKFGNMCIIEYLITQGTNNYNMGLIGASISGNLELVSYFIKKGATNFDAGIHHASRHEHYEIIEYLKTININ